MSCVTPIVFHFSQRASISNFTQMDQELGQRFIDVPNKWLRKPHPHKHTNTQPSPQLSELIAAVEGYSPTHLRDSHSRRLRTLGETDASCRKAEKQRLLHKESWRNQRTPGKGLPESTGGGCGSSSEPVQTWPVTNQATAHRKSVGGGAHSRAQREGYLYQILSFGSLYF